MAYIGKQPTVGNFVKLDAITTSATTTFNLLSGGVAYSPQSANHCIVSLNGVIQSPGTSFTISGSTIVFASALTSSDVIDFILVLGDVLNIGTPSDSTVGFSKITSNLITGATAETSIDGADSLLIYDDSATALRKMTKSNLFSGIANTPAFEAKLTSSQTGVTDNVATKMQFATEVFDTNSYYDNSTNYRFTPLVAGKYFVYAEGYVYGSVSNSLVQGEVYIYKNGSSVKLNGIIPNSSNPIAEAGFFVATVVDFNGSTDYVEVFAKGNVSSGTASFDASPSVFGAYRLIGV